MAQLKALCFPLFPKLLNPKPFQVRARTYMFWLRERHQEGRCIQRLETKTRTLEAQTGTLGPVVGEFEILVDSLVAFSNFELYPF